MASQVGAGMLPFCYVYPHYMLIFATQALPHSRRSVHRRGMRILLHAP